MYECHLTFDIKDSNSIKAVADRSDWKYSAIDGDPILGQNVYCYLTKHSTKGWDMLEEVSTLTDVDPIRVKLEKIEYDTKTDIDNSGGRFD